MEGSVPSKEERKHRMEKPATADHPIHELIQRRWSPRTFSDRSVDNKTILSLLEAARWAPSSYNEQPWYFIVAVRDNENEYNRLLECLVPGNQGWAKQAPVLMLSAVSLNFQKNEKPNRHAFHDLGLAVAGLSFQATAEGLFLHQMAGIDVQKARETFNIPEGYEAVTGIALGYPANPEDLPEEIREQERAPRARKALGEFVFSGSWGNRADRIGV